MRRKKLSTWAVLGMAALFPACLAAQTNCNEGAGPLRDEQPQGTNVTDILRQFSAHESEFQQALQHYNYTQEISVKTLVGPSVDGEFRRISTINYSQGKRMEVVTFSPQSTLRRVTMSKQDFDDIERSPFILNTQDLPQYNVKYIGEQKVDLLETYVFDVAPKQIEKGRRYFQGRVWVEARALAVVKSCGKNVPEEAPKKQKRKRGQRPEENVSPTLATYREEFEHKYWFPTYVRSDENLHFQYGDDVHLREVIKYTQFKRADSGANTASTAQPQ